MGDGEKLLTHLNSALKVLLGLDIFRRVPKKVKFCCPVNYVNIHIFSQLTWLSQTNCGWWRKTTYTFEFNVKSSIRIRYFPSCAKKKKLNFVDQCNLFPYDWFNHDLNSWHIIHSTIIRWYMRNQTLIRFNQLSTETARRKYWMKNRILHRKKISTRRLNS